MATFASRIDDKTTCQGSKSSEGQQTIMRKNSKQNKEAPETAPDYDENFISKSQKKRDSTALQAVGAELIAYTSEVIRKLELPEELETAVLDCKNIPPSKHGGFKRQMQYIGKLMREVDAAPILEKLQLLKAPSQKQTAQHHLAERWRDRMIADATAIAAFANEFAAADRVLLASYVTKAKDDHAAKRPPTHFRLLYKVLHKQILDKAKADATLATRGPESET